MLQEEGKRHAKRSQKTTSVNNVTTDGEPDVEQLVAICNQIGLEPTIERIRTINKLSRSDYSIPEKSWGLLVELFGKESMKKFIDKRKEITNPTNTSETIKGGRPYQNMPPIALKQVHANQSIMEHRRKLITFKSRISY